VKILVPVEDPLFGAAMVDLIARHSWPVGTQFIVVHVLEPYLLDKSAHITFSKLLEANEEQVISDATKLVNRVAEAINNSNPDAIVSQEVVQAHVKEQIIRMAATWGADLITVGTHGRSGFSQFVLGSVSLALTSELKVPMILVRPDAQTLKEWDSLPTLTHQSCEESLAKTGRRLRRVLIALDDTTLSEQLVDFVAKHSWDQDCVIRLFSAIEKPSSVLLPTSKAMELADELTAIAEARLQQFSRLLVSELKTSHVETMVGRGQPQGLILSMAQEWAADLLIVGCHFRNSIGKFLLGGVSLPTLCQSPCSVLLIKEKQISQPAKASNAIELIGVPS
jgi:nucleotide-binding universal stress UspA family protein